LTYVNIKQLVNLTHCALSLSPPKGPTCEW